MLIGQYCRMAALARPRTGRVFAGVCAALARRFGISVTVVRVLMTAPLVFFGLSFWWYVFLWVLIPSEN